MAPSIKYALEKEREPVCALDGRGGGRPMHFVAMQTFAQTTHNVPSTIINLLPAMRKKQGKEEGMRDVTGCSIMARLFLLRQSNSWPTEKIHNILKRWRKHAIYPVKCYIEMALGMFYFLLDVISSFVMFLAIQFGGTPQ